MRSIAAALTLVALAVGCRRAPAPAPVADFKPAADVKPAAKVDVAAPAKPAPGGGGLIAGVKRKVETAELRNALKQIGFAYTSFFEERRRTPNDLAELAPFYESNAKLSRYITEGDIVVAFKVPATGNGMANVPLAYEPGPDFTGGRLVATYGGVVEMMPEAEFQAMKNRK